MLIFHADLDNTLIYSYKHDIGSDTVGVERYQGRVISYMTGSSYEMLDQIRKRVLFVPVTTRTVEQYERIDLGSSPRFALVCNGGILLEDGQEDERWYEASLELVRDAEDELQLGEECLHKDRNRNFEVRNVRGLFLFTKSSNPSATVEMLRQKLDKSRVDVFQNGEKVYVVPRRMNKGEACRRFRKRVQSESVYTVAAGDSEFDIPMLETAELYMAPATLCDLYGLKDGGRWSEKDGIFSDFILSRILRMTETVQWI
ncbi:MAG: HAD hydrolase family protein [Lachnospiraceae bacterium]|nr:HAD hydrolase family protein [Lachnospiraceae bacterium]